MAPTPVVAPAPTKDLDAEELVKMYEHERNVALAEVKRLEGHRDELLKKNQLLFDEKMVALREVGMWDKKCLLWRSLAEERGNLLVSIGQSSNEITRSVILMMDKKKEEPVAPPMHQSV